SALTDKLYDRAAAAADTPLQRAQYRLSRAHYTQDRKDFAGVVKLCQEILSDDAMRTAAISEDTAAGSEAEAAITVAIRIDGRVGPAIDRLARAAKAAPADRRLAKPMPLPDGTALDGVTLVDAVDTLRKLQADADVARIPDLHIVPPKSGKSEAFAAPPPPPI